MTKATFRIIRFPLPTGDRYIGVAWNYDRAVLISTVDRESYTGARSELDADCEARRVSLQWFDGSYVSVGNSEIVPDPA